MKKNVRINRIGTSVIAGVMLANNIPNTILKVKANNEEAVVSNIEEGDEEDVQQNDQQGTQGEQILDSENEENEGEGITPELTPPPFP